MNDTSALGGNLYALARRSVSLGHLCANEESTKLYLILPFLGVLGYDYSNPLEVLAEHPADFDPRHANKVDFVVMRDGTPSIAIECKKVGADLAEARGQLRSYYNALTTVKLGILSNGLAFEFFVDSSEPNLMDDEPFLSIDLGMVASNGATAEALDALALLTKANFNPSQLAIHAQFQLLKKRLRSRFVTEANAPSEAFCRFFLQEVGVRNVRKATIDRYYSPLVKTAFHESIVIPLTAQLRKPQDGTQADNYRVDERIVTTDREIAIVNYVRRRLAYLVSEERLFAAIEKVGHKDYIGKLAVFYDRERKGRLFDFIEGTGGFDKFIFPEPYGEITTSNILDIDKALLGVFTTRESEISARSVPQAQVA